MGCEMKKAVFLDRDGIINEDGNYVHKPENFHFVDGIFDFCRAAQEKSYLLIVVTNQSGIARGYYTENDFLRLNDWMCAKFKEQGISINRVYYCPFHLEKGLGQYKMDSYDRKPNPGMFFKAKDEFDIDFQNSIVIGDRDSDMEAGRKAGVGKLLLLPGKYEYTIVDDVNVIRTLSDAERFL